MTTLLIVLIVLAVVVIAALALTNPVMRRREDQAIAAVREMLGSDEAVLLDSRTTAMGTDPEEAGGLRGMVCLGLGEHQLVAVPWMGDRRWVVERAAIVSVDTAADEPSETDKATVTVTYKGPDGSEATAMFRMRDAADWLTELGDGSSPGPATPADDVER